jgi:hypothetical protein
LTTTGLQCPTCGHIHPLAEVPGEGQFRCGGCNRLLSVPASLEPPAPADPDATQAHPAPTARRSAGDGATAPGAAGAGRAGLPLPGAGAPPPVTAWVRAPVWIVALALGFLVSAAVMRVVGLLDVDAVLDAFAGEGVGRYAMLLVFLPLWALLSAGAAHLTLEWLGRRWEQGRPGSDAARTEKAQSRKDERARRAV